MLLSFVTALSFVDIQKLTNDNIVDVNGEKWILSKRHKTKVRFISNTFYQKSPKKPLFGLLLCAFS